MRIFLAYRREDSKSLTGRVRDRLVRAFGEKNVFMDFGSIEGGSKWREKIAAALDGADVVLVMIGKHWLDCERNGQRRLDDPEDHHRFEVATALVRGKVVIPVTIDETALPADRDLSEPLRGLRDHQSFSIRDNAAFDRDVEQLIRDLAARFGGRRWEIPWLSWPSLSAWLAARDRALVVRHWKTRPRASLFQPRVVPAGEGSPSSHFWFCLALRALAVAQSLWVIKWCFQQFDEGTLMGLQQSLLVWGFLAAVLVVGGSRWATRLDRHWRRLWPASKEARPATWRERFPPRVRAYMADSLLVPLELSCVIPTLPLAASLWMEQIRGSSPQETTWLRLGVVVIELILLGAQIVRYWPVYRRMPARLWGGSKQRIPSAQVLAAGWAVGLWFLFNPLLLPTGALAVRTTSGTHVVHLTAADKLLAVASVEDSLTDERLWKRIDIDLLSIPELTWDEGPLEGTPWLEAEFGSTRDDLPANPLAMTDENRHLPDLAFSRQLVTAECGDWTNIFGFKLWTKKEGRWRIKRFGTPSFRDGRDQSVQIDQTGRIILFGRPITDSAAEGAAPAPAAEETIADVIEQLANEADKTTGKKPAEIQAEIGQSPASKPAAEPLKRRWGPPEMWIADSLQGELKRVPRTFDEEAQIGRVMTSPDGELVAIVDTPLAFRSPFHPSHRWVVVERTCGSVRLEGSATSGVSVDWIAFSPDGERLAVQSSGAYFPGDTVIYDVSDGSEVRRMSSVEGRPVWSPNSQHIAYLTRNMLTIYDAFTGEKAASFRAPRGRFTCHAFAGPDLLVAGTDQGRLWFYSVGK